MLTEQMRGIIGLGNTAFIYNVFYCDEHKYFFGKDGEAARCNISKLGLADGKL